MTDEQKQIIVGSLLGDGCLTTLRAHPTWNWRFAKNQSQQDKDKCDKLPYMLYHQKQFAEYSAPKIYQSYSKPVIIAGHRKPTPGTSTYVFTTRTSPIFTELARKWYKNDNGTFYRNKNGRIIKIIQSDLVLTPLTLCIWYMDDGCKEKGKNRLWLCTNGFTVPEVEFLIKRLEIDLSIQARLTFDHLHYPMIEVSGHSNCLDFYKHITPHIRWGCFAHKIEQLVEPVVLQGENHPKAKLTEAAATQIVNLHNDGANQTELAEAFGVKPNTINALIGGKSWKSLRISRASFGVKGERNPNAKLNTEQVVEIRGLKGKISYSVIAAKFGVTKGMVSHIMNGRSWTNKCP